MDGWIQGSRWPIYAKKALYIFIYLFINFTSCTIHIVSSQPRGGVSHMVGICGENVHRSQHLLAHPGVRHDASGQSLCHSAVQHVWPEEHLCPGYVRLRTRTKTLSDCLFVKWAFPCRFLVTCMLWVCSGFRSSLACWWRPQMGICTFTMWIRRMAASASLFRNTGVCVVVDCRC